MKSAARKTYAKPKAPNEALPRQHYSRETYRYGDGDVLQPRRIGSDHSHLKSFGGRT